MMLRLNWIAMSMAVVLAAGPLACGDDDDDDHASDEGDHDHGKGDASAGGKSDAGAKPGSGSGDELEVAGDWKSEFGDQTISVEDWDGAEVVEFDNDDNVAFTQYPDDAEFNAGKFSKLVWTEPGKDGFYYCTVDYGLDSLDDAKDSEKSADAKHPEDMGSCGDFTWTKLEPR